MMRNNRSSNERSSVVQVSVVAVLVAIAVAIGSNSGRHVVFVAVDCAGKKRLCEQARSGLGRVVCDGRRRQ